MEKHPPKTLFTISDLETLRVIADPLRAQVLELLIQQEYTVHQAAEKLGIPASRLYYHFNLLEKHGLIQVIETRMVANMQEKQYRATADEFEVHPDLLKFSEAEGDESIVSVVRAGLDATREEMLRSLQARRQELQRGAPQLPRRMRLTRSTMQLTESEAAEFNRKLDELVREMEAVSQARQRQPGEALQAYALTVAFYPNFYFGGSEQPSGSEPFSPEQAVARSRSESE